MNPQLKYMNLCIDVGNSRVKTAVFKRNTLINTHSFKVAVLVEKVKKISETYKIKNAIIASVSNIDDGTLDKIRKYVTLIILNNKLKFPFNIKYKTPKTLGVDRLALAAAATIKYPNENVLVIDAGTCITYDFISDKKNYYGGAIAPGLKMRYRALHKQTDKLPDLSPEFPKKIIGNTTNKSIHSGVCFGIICEIDGIIAKYRSNYQKLTVVLTGGDANFLAEKLKSSIFANPNFLLMGLNNILNFNLHE